MNKTRFLKVAFYACIIIFCYFFVLSILEGFEYKIAGESVQVKKPVGVLVATAKVLFLPPKHAIIPEPDPVNDPVSIVTPPSVEPYPQPDLTPVEPQPQQSLVDYVEIIDSCGPHYEGVCVNARSGPGTTFGSVAKLRNGVVLRVAEKVEAEGREWYKIIFKEYLLYPERVTSSWYVAADYARPFSNEGPKELLSGQTSSKRIVVDLSEQKIYAYDGEELFMEEKVSTGTKELPTPRGTFTIFKKTPSRFMQGPIPNLSDDFYDLPGVSWNMYFTNRGAAIHGAYWHDDFGEVHSHGCVNLPVDKAEELYLWTDLGTKVTVKD